MSVTEVFTAMQQGTADGQENALSVTVANKFEQVQKHLSLTGHVYLPSVFLINKATFDKLAPADQQAFLEAAKVAAKRPISKPSWKQPRWRPKPTVTAWLPTKKSPSPTCAKGMQVGNTVDKTKYQAALKPVFAEIEKQFGKPNLDRIREFK